MNHRALVFLGDFHFIVNAGLASSLGSKGALNAEIARIAREGFQKAGWSVLETNVGDD